MEIIKFNINSDEILDIFKVLDHDCLGKISIIELENYM
jgi:Ca2+-binding EF-hand superfamily protein